MCDVIAVPVICAKTVSSNIFDKLLTKIIWYVWQSDVIAVPTIGVNIACFNCGNKYCVYSYTRVYIWIKYILSAALPEHMFYLFYFSLLVLIHSLFFGDFL